MRWFIVSLHMCEKYGSLLGAFIANEASKESHVKDPADLSAVPKLGMVLLVVVRAGRDCRIVFSYPKTKTTIKTTATATACEFNQSFCKTKHKQKRICSKLLQRRNIPFPLPVTSLRCQVPTPSLVTSRWPCPIPARCSPFEIR